MRGAYGRNRNCAAGPRAARTMPVTRPQVRPPRMPQPMATATRPRTSRIQPHPVRPIRRMQSSRRAQTLSSAIAGMRWKMESTPSTSLRTPARAMPRRPRRGCGAGRRMSCAGEPWTVGRSCSCPFGPTAGQPQPAPTMAGTVDRSPPGLRRPGEGGSPPHRAQPDHVRAAHHAFGSTTVRTAAGLGPGRPGSPRTSRRRGRKPSTRSRVTGPSNRASRSNAMPVTTWKTGGGPDGPEPRWRRRSGVRRRRSAVRRGRRPRRGPACGPAA